MTDKINPDCPWMSCKETGRCSYSDSCPIGPIARLTIDRCVVNAADSFDWAKARVGVDGWLGPAHSFSLIRDGQMVCAVVYDAFTKYDCCLHLACEVKDVPQSFISTIYAYPFKQLGLPRITALIREGNGDALAVAERNGFRFEGRKRKANGDCDELIYGLLAEDCWHLSNYEVRDTI